MTLTNFTIYAAFMVCITGLAFHRAHLMSALICLEGMMLAIFIGLVMWCYKMESMSLSINPMALITLSACEASTGLAILVATNRTHGSDLIKNLNLLQC
uniref:NADH-ubiquinone oxidoreductase chain 4L n=1 Tax=Microcaecilia dermatophaga TaxID=1415579 RepID=W5RHL1_9AMPH|nr:NADH dehydrogenase subunit 4L [Microcaecilia dermatophaga]AGZ19054.1 NADH dehydrogenase subunit 4L [Microcaecilia dermatophaga]